MYRTHHLIPAKGARAGNGSSLYAENGKWINDRGRPATGRDQQKRYTTMLYYIMRVKNML